MTTSHQTSHLIFLLLASLIYSQHSFTLAADSPKSLPVFRADVDQVGNHRYTNYREPVVVRTKSGRLIVGVQAGNRLGWPERSGQDLVVRTSHDNGKTWSPIVVAAEHGDYSCQCHGLVYDAEINRVLFLYTVYNWDYQAVGDGRGAKFTKPVYERLANEGIPFVTSFRVHSDDEGGTWSKPVAITKQVGRQAHFGASEGRQLTTGSHEGRLLISGSRMDLDGSGNVVAKHPGVWRSDDHGETWSLAMIPLDPKIIGPRNTSSEARISELPDGRLLYNERTRNTGRQLSWSEDGGDSWTKTQRAADLKVTQCNGCTITLRDSAGRLSNTVLFSIPSPGGRSDGVLYASEDGGRTWPIRQNVVEGFFGYSALIQLDAATIGLFHEANHYKDIRFIALPWQETSRRAVRNSSSKIIDDRMRFLPDLPNSIGVAGPFVGVHNGTLIVAGGANFPNKSLIDGGQKVWHDQAYVLLPGNMRWDTDFKLKRPVAYGGSTSTKDGVVIVGGSDSERDYSEAWLLQWNEDEGGLVQSPLPPLPNATFECRAAAIGDRVYVVTGRSMQHPNHDFKKMWMLDLTAPTEKRVWNELSAWPGPARANTNLVVQEWNGRECLFLFAGVHVTMSDADEAVRDFRTDGYRYDPANDKWTAIASLPEWDDPRSISDKARFARQPASCTAGAAIGVGDDSIYVFGGTTGRYILLPDGTKRRFADRPLNPRRVLKYDVMNDRWSHIGQMPIGAIVTSAVKWNGQLVVPSGEIKPGIRTPRVQTLKLMEGGE